MLCMAMLPTHMRITHVMLLFHSATTMWLHHVFNLHYACPRQVSVDLIQTCTYSMIVYKGQGINWHPQSDSLEASPLKWTCSTHPIIGGSHCLVESLRQLTCFIGCFTPTAVESTISSDGIDTFTRTLIQSYNITLPSGQHILSSPTRVLPDVIPHQPANPLTECFHCHNLGHY